MRPAFSSTKQGAAFAGLLLLLLCLPLMFNKSRLPARKELYDSEGWGWGPYPWIRRQVFDETNDIDICFVGSSHMLQGVDTPHVQQSLNEKTGRQTVVRSVCWRGADYDVLYYIVKDLLEHRKVKMLVFNDESTGPERNALAWLLFRWGDEPEGLAGLPLLEQLQFYFAALVGMPRNLVCYLRSNLPAGLTAPPTLH